MRRTAQHLTNEPGEDPSTIEAFFRHTEDIHLFLEDHWWTLGEFTPPEWQSRASSWSVETIPRSIEASEINHATGLNPFWAATGESGPLACFLESVVPVFGWLRMDIPDATYRFTQ